MTRRARIRETAYVSAFSTILLALGYGVEWWLPRPEGVQ
jgi:hypothetical protein